MEPELSISDDRLRAMISVPAGMRLDLAQLKTLVVGRGICVGLRAASLVEAATVAEVDRDVVVAVGQPPQSQNYWKLVAGVKPGSPVCEGQTIAERIHDSQREERDGLGVDGVTLSVTGDQVCDVIIGGGLEDRGEYVQSKRDGVFVIADDIIWRIEDDPRGTPKKDPLLFTSDDDHAAWLRMEPGEFIPPRVLQELLASKQVVYGLDTQAIALASQGVDRAQTIEVARGSYAENGIDGQIEYLIDDRVHYEVRNDGTLDFRAAHPIQEVDKGQVLARIIPPTKGSPGMNICGKRLEPKPGRALDPARFCGEGVVAEGDGAESEGRLCAETNGVYNSLVSGKVQVREQVLIDGDVDMKSGNVESEYPIRITGDIKSGFTVKSQCDIVVDGSIEDARVSAQGNLQVKGGILPGDNRVKAHGDIQARFIEARHIKARSVLVQNSIRHSTIYATGEIVTQEILGGHAVAAQDITAKVAGDDHEQRTVLQAGVDPMQQAAFDEALDAKKTLIPRISRMEDALKAANKNADNLARKAAHLATQSVSPKHLKKVSAEGREALAEARRTRGELEDLMNELEQVEKHIADYENASSKSARCTVRIGSSYFPGVEIRIGRHARKRLTDPGSAAIFRIEEGVIVS